MAFTLEATIVIPLTMTLTISMIVLSAGYYKEIERQTHIESESINFANINKDLWNCKIEKENKITTKKIAVNPVKEKLILDFLIDTVKEVKELIPIFKDLEGIFINEKQ